MLRAGVVVALALAACAPVRAQADEFEWYSAEHLDTCLENAAAMSDAMRRCIGVGATPCIEAGGAATDAYILCWSHETADWQDRMNGAIGFLNANRTYRDPQRLAAANQAWEAWAEAECEYWAYEEGGGVGETVDRARCRARVTAERAITLIAAGAEP
jgi:uncharacterized protein YecT (DUF1311 family)